jgi:protease IV
MIKFLKYVLATMVGLAIFSFISLLIFIGVIGAAVSEREVEVASNSVLHLKLNRLIVERTADHPFEGLDLLPFPSTGAIGLLDLKQAVRKAKEDNNIRGIFLEPNFISAGFASLEEIREVLQDFKASGKFVISYSEVFTEADYYLATVADSIFLNPQGMLEFNGLSAQITFLKGTLEKLDIEPQVFRVGEFKSAVEPLVRENMSEENRMQTASFINSIYDHYLQNVSEARSIEMMSLRNISDSMLVRRSRDAERLNMVSRLAYYDEVEKVLRERLGLGEDEKVNLVSLGKYKRAAGTEQRTSRNRIGVVVASGNIVSGKGDSGSIGSDTFAEEIRKLRKDDKVKAIVIRINSPGGSALASDVIWREVKLAAEQKPVIASMSDVAASGGYYIAMACDTIVAQPTTITGSIGIFGVIFNLENFLGNKLGITTDVVKTGQFSDIFTLTRGLTPYEQQIIQQYLEEGYDTFTRKAAEGRSMEQEELKKLAGGRVWSGIEAQQNGLVDVLGSLDDAVKLAANAAGIGDDYRVRYYPREKTFFEQLLSDLGRDAEMKLLEYHYGEYFPYFKKLKTIEQYRGMQARLPFDLEIK